MLKEFETPLTLELQRSALLDYYLITVHALAFVAVIYSSVNALVQIFSILFISFHYLFKIRQQILFKKIIWSQENNWCLYHEDGSCFDSQLSSLSFLSSWLVILVFNTEVGRRVSVLVPFDSLERTSFRRLKQRLVTIKPKYLRTGGEDE